MSHKYSSNWREFLIDLELSLRWGREPFWLYHYSLLSQLSLWSLRPCSVTIYPKNDWRKLTFCFLSAQSWASGRHTLPLHPGYTSVPRASLAPLRVTPFRPNSPRFRLFCLGRGRFCLRLGLRLFCWPSTTRMHTRASRSAWGSSRLVVAHC